MNRLEELLALWEAGELSPAELAELKQRLAAPEGRAELVNRWLLTETIYDTFRAHREAAPAVQLNPVPNRRVGGIASPSDRRRRLPWLVWREFHFSIGRLMAWGAAACLGLAVLGWYFQKAAVARLAEAREQVVIYRRGRGQSAASGQALYVGDTVIVPPTGAASITWPGESSVVNLSGGARFALLNPMFGKKMALQAGAMEAAVAPQPGLRPLKILTPEAEARVVGTRFSLAATSAVTRIEVLEGAVRFRKLRPASSDRQRQVLVRAGYTATAAPNVPLGVDWLTGFLSSDVWVAPVGAGLTDAPALGALVDPPAAASLRSAGSNVVERLRGYLLAPATGDFVFWVASHRGGASVELWLSPDESSARKRRIAFEPAAAQSVAGRPGASLQSEFHRTPTQQSGAQPLEQGKRYYLEIWRAEVGLETLGFGWRRPGQSAAVPPEMVDLNLLCPFIEPNVETARK